MKKNLISAYAGEALHTSSKYLIGRNFDLSLDSLPSNESAYQICLQREKEAYSHYIKSGPLTYDNFMKTLREGFIQSGDREVLARFAHQNLKNLLPQLSKKYTEQRHEKLFQNYEFTIVIDENIDEDIKEIFKKTFPRQMQSKGSVELNLGIKSQQTKLNAALKEVAEKRKTSKKKPKSTKETLIDLEEGLVAGLQIAPGKHYPTSISTAIELDTRARSFPWGFYKADIEKALETNDAYYISKLNEAYNALKEFFTETLTEGGSYELHRAANIVWEDKLGTSLSSSLSFFEKGDVDNLKIGAAGEFQAALIFTYFDIIFGGEGKEIAKIAGDEMINGTQGKIDVSLLGKYGIQVKNYDTIIREMGMASTHIATGTNLGSFSEYLSDPRQGEDLRAFFANYYFNKSFAEQRSEDYQRAIDNIGQYAYGLFSLALNDSLAEDRVSFYLVGGQFLIPASDIIATFNKEKQFPRFRSPDIAIKGIPQLTDEEFEEQGLEQVYWKQASNLTYYPTETNQTQYKNLLYRNITIKSYIDYKQIIGDIFNSKYSLI